MDSEIENYMRTLNLDEVCRTCLSESDEMTSLFTEIEPTDDDEDISFVYQILMNVSSMQVFVDDGLPTYICKNCIESANNAFKFKVLCERSEALLQAYLSHIRIKNEIDPQKTDETSSEMTEQIPYGYGDSDENIQISTTTSNNESKLEENYTEDQLIESHDQEIVNEEIIMFETTSKNAQETIHNEDVQQIKLEYENNEISVQELVIKPDIIEIEETGNGSAALVASSDENIRLRERIALKNQQSKLPRRKRRYSYTHSYRINEAGEKLYTCHLCNKEYKHAASLTVHIRTHTLERPYLCPRCGKGFKQFTGLTYHLRSHTGEQPYACRLCDKRYRQSASLTAHMRIHTGQRPFLCSICGKGFRQQPDLGYHMRTHTQEKPYMCAVCGKRMSMQCHLVQHMRTHTGERPFVCSACGKGFASTTRLKRHEIIHTGLKPFVCNVCKKAFNRNSTLRVHLMTHSDQKPHHCQVCGKGFIQAHCLRAHLKTHA